MHYGRKGQPTVAPTLHGKRACAHRSARVARVLHVARVVAVALTGRRGKAVCRLFGLREHANNKLKLPS